MKRYLACILCLLSLSFCLCFTVSAAEPECTISEDLQTLYYDGEAYSRVNTLALSYYDQYLEIGATLSQSQQERFCSAQVCLDESKNIADVTLLCPDGMQITLGYLHSSYLEEYERLLTAQTGQCSLEYYWDTIIADLEDLKGTPTTLDKLTVYWGDDYKVCMATEDESFSVIRGTLLIDGTDYYYIDHGENGIVDRANYYASDATDGTQAYRITDLDLCDAIQETISAEFDYDGWSDDGTEVLSAVLMSLLFGVLPCAALAVALVFTFRSKGFYRTAWGVTAGICAAELIVFVIILGILLLA